MARDHRLTTQVAVAPGPGGTTIKVHQRIDPRVRILMHLLPSIWGSMAGVIVAMTAGATLVPGAGIVAGCAVAGVAAGRGVWELLARRSQRRVDRLASDLAGQAQSLASQHTVIGDAGDGDGDEVL
jgi:hypothetical protein